MNSLFLTGCGRVPEMGSKWFKHQTESGTGAVQSFQRSSSPLATYPLCSSNNNVEEWPRQSPAHTFFPGTMLYIKPVKGFNVLYRTVSRRFTSIWRTQHWPYFANVALGKAVGREDNLCFQNVPCCFPIALLHCILQLHWPMTGKEMRKT